MEYLADTGVAILIFVALGLSLNLLVGLAGQVSLAHAIFYGLGAYGVGLLTLPTQPGGTEVARGVTSGAGWPFLPALIVGTAVAFFAAIIIALPALRITGEYVILMTLAFQIVANQLMNTLSTVTGGPYGLTPIPPATVLGLDLRSPQQAFIVFLVMTGGIALLSWWMTLSPFGRVLRGIRGDEEAVSASGKNTTRAKLAAFSIAAGIAGLVGGVAASYYQFIAPGNYSLEVSIFLVAVVVLGGSGNVMGVILGGVILGGLAPVLTNVIGDTGIVWRSVFYGFGLVVVMYVRPSGVFPEGTGLDRIIERRLYRPLLRRAHVHVGEQEPVRPSKVEGAEPSDSARSDGPTLIGQDLVKRFNGLTAVAGVDIELPHGKITGLVGPNGAGKTTVFNLMTGTINPDRGKVFLRGEDITGLTIDKLVHRGLARSFQDVRVFDELSVLENVAIAVPDQAGEAPVTLMTRPWLVLRSEATAREKAVDALTFVGIENLREEQVGDLSFGDQKLVAIARVLATEADVLLLDEPTSGVAPDRVEEIIESIKALRNAGKTICLIEHSVHLIQQLADHVIFLDNGRVVARGPMEELMARDDLVEIYFGT